MAQTTIMVVATLACVSALGAAVGNTRQVSNLSERVDSIQAAVGRGRPPRRETPTFLGVAALGVAAEGSVTAPITIVEFTDYQCPFCRRFADETLPLIRADYIKTGLVKLIIRDLPLPMHPHAPALAAAARCVYALAPTKFMAFHDQIFASQSSLSASVNVDDRIDAISKEIGVPLDGFRKCKVGEHISASVQRDAKDAAGHGLSGTPAFIIGRSAGDTIRGRVINGAAPIAQFRIVLDSLIKAVNKR